MTQIATPTSPQSAPSNGPLPGFKEFIVGDSGNGKTHVCRTLLGSGIQPFCLATEAGFRSLAPCDYSACEVCKDNRNSPPIPVAFVPPTAGNIDILIEQARNVATMTQQQLCNVVDKKREADFGQFVEVLKQIKEFRAIDGQSYGSVTQWNTDRCLIFDGISSLGQMAMDLFCGRRPLYDKPDYQIAQRGMLNFFILLTQQIRCHVIVIGHVGRGEDSLESKNKVTVNTVGQKLAPELPRLFDDMIHAERQGAVFTWSTATTNTVAKARNLGYKEGQKPDFRPIIASWKKAGGLIVPTTE